MHKFNDLVKYQNNNTFNFLIIKLSKFFYFNFYIFRFI